MRGGILPGRRDRTGHFYVSLDALEPALRLRQVSPDMPAGTLTDKEIDARLRLCGPSVGRGPPAGGERFRR